MGFFHDWSGRERHREHNYGSLGRKQFQPRTENVGLKKQQRRYPYLIVNNTKSAGPFLDDRVGNPEGGKPGRNPLVKETMAPLVWLPGKTKTKPGGP